ncbi:MAG: hypothetical protein HYZ25_16065 [Chloroflexi bacterium]|nr:hypothetical protein [Chloroflexota bacterium]
MMEMMLALAVLAAVIVFGTLISLGNERQRRAIDALQDQIVSWAVQDLKIKRDHLAREVRVDDPLGWLNRLTSRAFSSHVELQIVEFFEDPQVLVCQSGDGTRVLFSPLSKSEIHVLNKMRKGKLAHYTSGNPLLRFPRGTRGQEFSPLNSGAGFDLELRLAWKGLTGREAQSERLWMYMIG